MCKNNLENFVGIFELRRKQDQMFMIEDKKHRTTTKCILFKSEAFGLCKHIFHLKISFNWESGSELLDNVCLF